MSDRPDFKNCDQCEMPRSCQGVRSCAKKVNHRPRDPSSMQGQVEALVEQHGPCTVDRIAPMLPHFTRCQVRITLSNLHSAGRLVITNIGNALGRGRGSKPSEYDLASRSQGVEATAQVKSARAARFPRVSSVWDLGAMA